ncbi:PTS system D-mannitol-specific IIABC component, Fru family [Coriobacterium glomerans PW2]|uniref:Mannitol-specific phosphotransferase enzyme IIA component n=1 Tax=Coriobacterium glomerans (strain ATCC 49209 / DSM 20642 / JCM 10262 / PW2) TaxID=700015 RepID=F2N725_CORGP|nr:PTS mannitol transporter subunit IICBA [Coriobacterium glomerans]AEB06364.1 PTS system D-mannitol-specific IIABC component, Fru family [Coriobacterium glomerans PW2]
MSLKDKVSRFGKFLSGMVMPNIGAFIAWGFLTALFNASGWLPNPRFAEMVSPMLNYLIPILIAAQGAYMIGGDRGRIIGPIAVVGCVIGAPDYPMLMGAMIMGPFAGLVIKKFDRLIEGRTPPGFEMLVDNFSVGILGMLLAMLGYVAIGPIMAALLQVLSAGVSVLVRYGLMPLLAIFIEPAKVLFLNNAINHGIFTPIGGAQVEATGHSIMYMLEANPGPGLGILLAYCFFSRDAKTRQSAPGAVIIHFLGGIHEIYFPYILMNPKIIIAPIAGNICAISWFAFTGSGLVAPASPGSIIAFLSMAPPDHMVVIIIGVAIATAVSFLVAAPIVRSAAADDLEGAEDRMRALKGESDPAAEPEAACGMIVFACDAGMGSSAMGATRFRNRIKENRPDLVIRHASVDCIPAEATTVVCQRTLSSRARRSAPGARIVEIDSFLDDPALDRLAASLGSEADGTRLASDGDTTPAVVSDSCAESHDLSIDRCSIQLGLESVSRAEALRAAGKLLVDQGFARESYADAIAERDRLASVYLGMGVAIPHGTRAASDAVIKTGVVLQQYPEGIDFDGEKAYLLFGIAGRGSEHLKVLANICGILENEKVLAKLKTTDDIDWILKVLS